MGLFHKYVEVYSTLKLEDLFRAKNLLAEHHITFKDTSTGNQMRLSSNHIRGNDILLSRGGFAQSVYTLSVKKEEEGKAKQVLQTLFKRS